MPAEAAWERGHRDDSEIRDRRVLCPGTPGFQAGRSSRVRTSGSRCADRASPTTNRVRRHPAADRGAMSGHYGTLHGVASLGCRHGFHSNRRRRPDRMLGRPLPSPARKPWSGAGSIGSGKCLQRHHLTVKTGQSQFCDSAVSVTAPARTFPGCSRTLPGCWSRWATRRTTPKAASSHGPRKNGASEAREAQLILRKS
jgi:hypothetical protein